MVSDLYLMVVQTLHVGIQDKNDVLSSNTKENQVKNDNHDATDKRSSLT